MGKVVRIKNELNTVLGNGSIGFHSKYKVGELFYVEPYKDVKGTNNYYPFSGGYPIWDRQVDMAKFTELAFTTKKGKNYFIDRKFTQYEVDEMLKLKTTK